MQAQRTLRGKLKRCLGNSFSLAYQVYAAYVIYILMTSLRASHFVAGARSNGIVASAADRSVNSSRGHYGQILLSLSRTKNVIISSYVKLKPLHSHTHTNTHTIHTCSARDEESKKERE